MARPLDITFEEFKKWLMKEFATEYVLANTTHTNPNAYQEFELSKKEKPEKKPQKRNVKKIKAQEPYMLAHYDYTPEREKFLIDRAQQYIPDELYGKAVHFTSPVFLRKLMNKMAEYLSRYVAQKYTDNRKSQNTLRLDAQKELQAALFDDNPYIISLLANQKKKRDLRSLPSEKRKQLKAATKRLEKQIEYRQARKVQNEVKAVFDEAHNIPRGR